MPPAAMGESVKENETGYHGLRDEQYGGDKKVWKNLDADFHQDADSGEVLKIDGHPVMEQWEQPYMAALAKVATKNGGKVLEVGFGLGLSATAIQSFKIDEHIIIEANAGVIERGKKWSKLQSNPVRFLHGLWQEVVASLDDNSVDGILYDTYPLTQEEQHIHQFDFLKQIYRVLKPGGICTYCNLTSIGVLKGRYPEWAALWKETQVPHLEECGFKVDEKHAFFETCDVNPPDTCEYYSGHKQALIPVLLKSE